MKLQDVDIFGRKIFFVAPDTSIITKNYLQELCLLGFEAHVISDDATCPMKDKIDVIIDLFPGCIIYFNVSSKIKGIIWNEYIKALKERHNDNVLVGILYCADTEQGRKEDIERHFTQDMKVKAGCIGLGKNNEDNFATIESVLERTGAKGRRNSIRVDCDENSTVRLFFEGKNIVGKIQDVNISHFRCLFDSSIEMKIFDKIRDANITVNGTSFISDIVLIMKRQKVGENIAIFMFIHDKPQDTPELSQKNKDVLNRDIFEIMTKKGMQILQQAFLQNKTTD